MKSIKNNIKNVLICASLLCAVSAEAQSVPVLGGLGNTLESVPVVGGIAVGLLPLAQGVVLDGLPALASLEVQPVMGELLGNTLGALSPQDGGLPLITPLLSGDLRLVTLTDVLGGGEVPIVGTILGSGLANDLIAGGVPVLGDLLETQPAQVLVPALSQILIAIPVDQLILFPLSLSPF